jgi:hypothetical protein
MPHIQYFDRSGRPLSKRDACEADGKTLRDGISMRIPAHLADHAPRFSDARAFWDSNKASLLVVDARRIGGSEGNKPGFRVLDNDLGRAEREAAYREHEAYLRDAWRNPPPRDAAFGSPPYGAYPLSAGEGNQCTVDGRPGRLERAGDVLICKPLAADARALDARTCPTCEGTGEDDDGDDCETCGGSGRVANGDNGETASSDHRTVDAVSADHQRRMQRDFYDAYAREISEAWRKR